MKHARPGLLLLSSLIVVLLVGGGLVMKAGAGDDSYRQVVLFSEVFSLVNDNYVDPVDPSGLLASAYEGMLAGLDANGAYLSPGEVKAWKAGDSGPVAHPGIGVLKAGRSLQVVSVEPGSPAELAGIHVGDQIRTIDDSPVRDLSLKQAWALVAGRPGTTVRFEVLRASEGFERQHVEVRRESGFGRAYDLGVKRGIAVLQVRDMRRLPIDQLAAELEQLGTSGVGRLLIDLRNVTDLEPRRALDAAGLFASGAHLNLRERSGTLVESLETPHKDPAWSGNVTVLVNGATAGSAEALASLMAEKGAPVLGEATYGLGAEAKLFELENGAGLVVSAALWETASGRRWNSEGLEPVQEIHGRGDDFSKVSADQLERALDWLEKQQADGKKAEPKAAA